MDDPDFDDDADDELTSPNAFFFSASGFEAALGLAAVAVGLLFGPPANALVPALTDWREVIWGTALGCVLSLPMYLFVRWLETLEIASVDEINQFGRDHIVPLIRDLKTTELATLSLCAGIGEELLFRGWLQMLLTGPADEWTIPSLIIGIGIASIAFGLVHAITRMYVIVVTLMGIAFGLMLVLSGNLLVPIFAHAMFDYIQLRRAVNEEDDEHTL
ncbi:MAG: CPBP family intramembrane glutamic endopeptidase [Pirellulaceae bacterium]